MLVFRRDVEHDTCSLPVLGIDVEDRSHLLRANLGLEKLRFFIRLAVELKMLDHRRYEHGARLLDEIGRLVGGWAKAHASHFGSGAGHGQEAH